MAESPAYVSCLFTDKAAIPALMNHFIGAGIAALSLAEWERFNNIRLPVTGAIRCLAHLLHVNAELPHLLIQLVTQILELIGRYIVAIFGRTVNPLTHTLGNRINALGHDLQHLPVG